MFDKLMTRAMTALVFLASAAMTIMILIIVIDVAGREFFNSPLTGAYELVEFCMGLLCCRRWKRSPVIFMLIMGAVCGLLRLAALQIAGM